ncbi:Nucleic acid-binding, OB-fold [Sesbania bispinosa]|nr:Nucleic acid-binding, OB-fold [Sesbania bispinosa]
MALVPGHFHMVTNLCGRRENWRLRLKLVRVWNMSTVAKPNDPFATQMVFIDEEGGRIEATVPKQHMQRFSNSVVEGEVYLVTNFTLNRNSGKFRACGHEYKMVFHGGTRVVRYERISIPLPGFAF